MCAKDSVSCHLFVTDHPLCGRMREIMATKKIFLVDTENVGSTWKDLLPIKTASDQILLFFTENSPNISYVDLELILQFPDRVEMIKCNPGKNGLDFQLVSYLGYLLKTASKSNYIIVSNDSGFDAVVKFWQDRGMSISRMNVHRILQPNSIPDPKKSVDAAATKPKRETAVPPAEPPCSDGNIEFDFSNLTVSEREDLLRKYLPQEFYEDQKSFETISDIMFGHDTQNHHQLHLAFVKNFGDEKGTLLYKTFRKHLSEFRA